MTHEVWVDGERLVEGAKSDCERVAVWLREQMRTRNEKVAGRVGVHAIATEED